MANAPQKPTAPAAREITQFSHIEFAAFTAKLAEVGEESFKPSSPREQGMMDYFNHAKGLRAEDFAHLGGPENVQRVRVLEVGGARRFDFTTKVPPALLDEKRRKERRAQVEKALQALLNDPVALQAFLDAAVVEVIGRARAASLMHTAKKGAPKPAKPARKAPVVQRVKKLTPREEAFEAAFKQRRVEAAKAYQERKATKGTAK